MIAVIVGRFSKMRRSPFELTIKYTIFSIMTLILFIAMTFLFLDRSSKNSPVLAGSYDATELDTSEFPWHTLPPSMAYDQLTNSLWLPVISEREQSYIYQYDIDKDRMKKYPVDVQGTFGLSSGIDVDENGGLWIGFNSSSIDANKIPNIVSTILKFDTTNHMTETHLIPALQNEFKGDGENSTEVSGYIFDLTVGSDAKIYLTRWRASSITVFDTSNSSFEEIRTPAGYGVPGKMNKNDKELWFETHFSELPKGAMNKILKYEMTTGAFKVFDQPSDGNMAFGADGAIFLRGIATGESIIKYDTRTEKKARDYTIVSGPNTIHKLFTSADGKLWFTQDVDGVIKNMDPGTGAILSEYAFPADAPLSGPPSIPAVLPGTDVQPDVSDLVMPARISDIEEDRDGNLYFIVENFRKLYKVDVSPKKPVQN